MRNKVSRERRRIRKEILNMALTYVNESTSFYTCDKLANLDWFKDIDFLLNELKQENTLKLIDLNLIDEKFIRKTVWLLRITKPFALLLQIRTKLY